MSHTEEMKQGAKAFILRAESLKINISGFSVSENDYGVSIYFKGFDSFGNEFHFRFSDHDCQRGRDTITKISLHTKDSWLDKYEQINYPENFEWEYFDKYILCVDGVTRQVKKLIGRKAV
jgi:hypothetical protein